MKSFDKKSLPALPLTHDLMRSVGALHEYRGREQLSAQQARQALDTLEEVAVLRSAESSNRIEGVEAAPERIEKLMEKSAAPETRSEQAIAGYRDVLNTIHTRHDDIEFSTGVVRQLHRDLCKYTSSRGRNWKSTGNDIIEEHPDGTEVVRFETVPPHRTPEYMKTLHERFDRAWKMGGPAPAHRGVRAGFPLHPPVSGRQWADGSPAHAAAPLQGQLRSRSVHQPREAG
ncbi:Fic family protein [Salinibacter ruber]|uniref:hypothetical protein n=1 Tax=Salinibacter ruber TaxID=146919 RepID=UPI002169D4DB|nr:hypothetical protein [Salinibacter ruber]MCS3856609.1 Fic family protein [Salinibacter ruber]